MKRIIGVLVVLIMLVSMMPMGVFAAEIGSVSLNVTAPAVHATPVFQATCNHDNYVIDTAYKGSTNGVFWYDDTDQKQLTASDRFVEGHKYTVSVVLATTSGNKFALDTGVGVHTAVSGSINGSSAKVALSGESMLKIVVSRTFVIPSKLSTVAVTDIEAPVAGQKPDHEATTGNGYKLMAGTANHFINGIYWYDITDAKTLTENDTFVEGHQYRLFLCVTVDETNEYQFAVLANGQTGVKATVNGESANVIQYLKNPLEEIINVYYDFPACSNPEVTSVTIENFPIPQAGKAPEYTADITSEGLVLADTNNTFTKNGIFWSHKVKGFDLTPTDFFYSGHVYIATINLTAKQGYELKQPITATVNGNAASATVSGGKVIVKYEVRCPDYQIDKVDIKGVAVPSIGKSPSVEMECAEPNLYEIKNASWYVDDTLMSETDKFIAGKNYDLVVYVDPKQEGWDYVAQFADKVAVTVNGNKVSEKKVERLGNSVKFTYTFTAAASAKIGAVDIVGIDAPVAGKTPDYTAELPNSDTYMIDTSLTDRHTSKGISWRNASTGKFLTTGIDQFEAGNVYEVLVTVTPHKGYEFVTKADGTPDIGGTINGKTATDIMGRNEYEAILVYQFPVCEEAAEEPEKPEKPETPVDPEQPEQTDKLTFVDVEKGAYYYEPVVWAVKAGVTAGTSATTFSPEDICTRAQVVTFLWRMLASPEPALMENPFVDVKSDAYYYKPVQWAVGSQITSGTSANTFSPEENCTRAQVVTFLWRTAGKPEPKGNQNPFTDVTADSYYYKAVLWAVENGITSGTSATKFSPDEACTRAQIVTFLYRFINK